MRILFWGTPEFATPALRALLGEGHDVVAVVTQPDRAQGRSRSTMVPPPVKLVAEEEGLAVLQPERPRGKDFIDAIGALAPDISVVVAYGHILVRDVIDLPAAGTLNIHASLLPRWRGAAPIQAALIAGDVESGVTIMRMVQQLDAGPILRQARTPIPDDETGGELLIRLSELGAQTLVEALTLLSLGGLTETAQDESLVTWAPRIDRQSAMVEWSRPAGEVSRVIRAFDPRPGAWTTHRGAPLKLSGVRALDEHAAEPAGTVITLGDAGMVVTCGTGTARITHVQPAGKRRLAVGEWVAGRGVLVGERFA
ncbi:MAG: methionyl-tRNA formyltransferase [Gemmatimonadota bacterium]